MNKAQIAYVLQRLNHATEMKRNAIYEMFKTTPPDMPARNVVQAIATGAIKPREGATVKGRASSQGGYYHPDLNMLFDTGDFFKVADKWKNEREAALKALDTEYTSVRDTIVLSDAPDALAAIKAFDAKDFTA